MGWMRRMRVRLLIYLSLIGIVMSLAVVVWGCRERDELVVVAGVLGFVLNGYNMLFLMWMKPPEGK